ncbi:hypothetical protein LOZ12_000164 [Ophidiomyces ophidiicola]|uniref:Uncharacterized protein n=1 Tax=Ophidiomyces ophidiicola TaxID=1387563 RepID=A0ACB8V761_9EURO|nr:hypothetical protein LOZ64_000964 [Ophidiomyces ophidiicola]KAI1956043.1 hypothetical protein LOZ62_000035 [Ophidiomyces ophidiicola]KAI1975177.1 hypothetical protein LOZ56_000701 [Ophidiomyces ophidiicola]KAI2005730.1 hypothetical protein LOZ50_003515 [Ophidiomyces ophidiicola]KAI2021434.1 hypothetical protein LOZ48_006405 [Ophidiomyces ophidiicola]
MSHVRPSKRRGSKKAASPFRNPMAVVANAVVARSFDDSSDAKARPRSKSISQTGSDREIAPGRRRAATRLTEVAVAERAPDVFQFLDQDDPDAAVVVKARGAADRRYTEPAAKKLAAQPQDRSRDSSGSYSFRSDSGVSVRDPSPGAASSADEYQPPTPPDVPLKWDLAAALRGKKPARMAGAYTTDTESLFENQATPAASVFDVATPESFYYAKHLPTTPTPHKRRPRPDLPSVDTARAVESARRTSLAMLSPRRAPEQPAAEPRPRIYRKFDALNHRLLRHLQEEIIQLEEDLSTLDELEAAHQASPNTRNSPRQKMLAAKYHDLQIQDYSVLHYKRTDLIEKVAAKTEQYNRALCSFNKVVQTLPSPSDADIETYSNALTTSPSPARGDRRILDHKSDLVLVAPSRRPAADGDPDAVAAALLHPQNPIYSTIAAICAAILFPLLAFGAISEFFGRIVIVAIIGGMIALWASNGPPGHEYLIDPHDGWKCAVLYFGFMSIAAAIIS